MKKALGLLAIIPFLCACSATEISSEKALSLVNDFETKLEQKTSFSFYERKEVSETKTTKLVNLTQIFFEENFFHSYSVFEDHENPASCSAIEKWSFIKDKKIYDVTDDGTGNRSHTELEFDKEFWEGRMKAALNEVKGVNIGYFNKVVDEINQEKNSAKLVLLSKNSGSLIHKIERYGNDGTVIRSKTYEFEDSLIYKVIDKDDYSLTTIDFKYKITTQEPNIPNF